MQEFYFGKVDLTEFDPKDLDKETLFKNGDDYYWYKMDITEDGITFYDTCDRAIPISKDHLRELEIAVYVAREYDLAIRAAEQLKNDRINRIARTLTKLGSYYA